MKKANLANRKKVFIVSIVGSIVTILTLVGLTYGYYTSTITGGSKTITGKTVDLKLVFNNGTGDIKVSNIYPGWSDFQVFTVQNTAAVAQKFNIVVNSAMNGIGSNVQFAICRGSSCALTTTACSSSLTTNCRIATAQWPNQTTTLVSLEPINANTTNTYTLYMSYANTNSDQNNEMGRSFSGSLTITSAKYNNTSQGGYN